MSLRFRKSINLLPGVRMNLTGSGLSWTVGPRGFSMNVGKRGAYLNAGLPGTGLYSRTKLTGVSGDNSVAAQRAALHYPAGTPATAPTSETLPTVRLTVDDVGSLRYSDTNGQPVSERVIELLKKKKGDEVRVVIERLANEIAANVEALGQIHLATPDPDEKPAYAISPFAEREPQLPDEPELVLADRLLPWRRKEIESQYSTALAQAMAAQDEWVRRKAIYAGQQARRKMFIESDIYKDTHAMENYLGDHLQGISWPRETHVTFEIEDGGEKVSLDVDLPEIEQMPTRTARAASRGYQILMKDLTLSQRLQLYMQHVHGIGFRIIGETFAALPRCAEVVLSAYSQRANPATAQVHDEYLYSIRVMRNAWRQLNFSGLKNIDVVEALGQFELCRDMTPGGVFRAIERLK